MSENKISSATKRPPQRFNVSHFNEADFKSNGLRTYARYRDLGMTDATGGLVQAHVIRFVPPATAEVRQRHKHDVEFQMVYVLKGWFKADFEGHGTHTMRAGSAWMQPPGIPHNVVDFSDDCEVLEIVLPAEFKTTDL